MNRFAGTRHSRWGGHVWRLAGLCATLGAGCSNAPAERAKFISPQYQDVCDNFDCSDVGDCVWLDAGAPSCACLTGYAGAHCEACAEDFHRDAYWHCVPDRHCDDQAADPCGDHGACKDDGGVIACDCKQGYQGARCDLCATGYESESEGACAKKGSAK